MILTESDLHQIAVKGISHDQIDTQVEIIKNGVPFLDIIKPAVVGDGIINLSESELLQKIRIYNQEHPNKKIVKFVPASGAASRMFKLLYEFLNSEKPEELLQDKNPDSISSFFANLKHFAFYHDLKSCEMLKHIDFDTTLSIDDCKLIINALLTESGLNYSFLPKGLLKFHQYEKESKTATQEHIMEGALYAASNEELFLHFTVSPEHKYLFKDHIRKSIPPIERLFELSCYVSFSIQKPSTDTIAVDENYEVFRLNDGTMFFRPGGHGALIENLGELDADIIFIKNIDNVAPDRLKKDTTDYKKALAGLLIEIQNKVFSYLKKLHSTSELDAKQVTEIENFVFNQLSIIPFAGYQQLPQKERIEFLINKLNRPIRVCGMVKNVGEPGGGPFWAMNPDGTCSLQIVESSQIDMANPEKANLVARSTHFNPVDLVCGITDYKVNNFDLKKYVDPKTSFITDKSKDGKNFKTLELPGLWNGSMSDWITLFVEVPITTFSPVKTVYDLLRPEHQP